MLENKNEHKKYFTGQEYTSANTSINSCRVPALFKKVPFKRGQLNLDIGGGKYDTAVEYCAKKGVTNLIYDPYNRTKEHNAKVLKVVSRRKADSTTCSNVLNVIKEQEIRRKVIQMCKDFVKLQGYCYFSMYEGTGEGIGTVNRKKNSYQSNRKTKDYISEIEVVFGKGNVKYINNMIVCVNNQ